MRVLPTENFEFVADSIPERTVDLIYPGDYYGRHRDFTNKPEKAKYMTGGFFEAVKVPLSSKPILYIPLRAMFVRNKVGKGLR